MLLAIGDGFGRSRRPRPPLARSAWGLARGGTLGANVSLARGQRQRPVGMVFSSGRSAARLAPRATIQTVSPRFVLVATGQPSEQADKALLDDDRGRRARLRRRYRLPRRADRGAVRGARAARRVHVPRKGGAASADVVVPRVALNAGRACVLAPYGPTASLRVLDDQVAVPRVGSNGAFETVRATLARARSAGSARRSSCCLVLAGSLAHAYALASWGPPRSRPCSRRSRPAYSRCASRPPSASREASTRRSSRRAGRRDAVVLAARPPSSMTSTRPSAASSLRPAPSRSRPPRWATRPPRSSSPRRRSSRSPPRSRPSEASATRVGSAWRARARSAFPRRRRVDGLHPGHRLRHWLRRHRKRDVGDRHGAHRVCARRRLVRVRARGVPRVRRGREREHGRRESARGQGNVVIVPAIAAVIGGAALGIGTTLFRRQLRPVARRLSGSGSIPPHAMAYASVVPSIVASGGGALLGASRQHGHGGAGGLLALGAPTICFALAARGIGLGARFLERGVGAMDRGIIDDVPAAFADIYRRITGKAIDTGEQELREGGPLYTGVLVGLPVVPPRSFSLAGARLTMRGSSSVTSFVLAALAFSRPQSKRMSGAAASVRLRRRAAGRPDRAARDPAAKGRHVRGGSSPSSTTAREPLIICASRRAPTCPIRAYRPLVAHHRRQPADHDCAWRHAPRPGGGRPRRESVSSSDTSWSMSSDEGLRRGRDGRPAQMPSPSARWSRACSPRSSCSLPLLGAIAAIFGRTFVTARVVRHRRASVVDCLRHTSIAASSRSSRIDGNGGSSFIQHIVCASDRPELFRRRLIAATALPSEPRGALRGHLRSRAGGGPAVNHSALLFAAFPSGGADRAGRPSSRLHLRRDHLRDLCSRRALAEAAVRRRRFALRCGPDCGLAPPRRRPRDLAQGGLHLPRRRHRRWFRRLACP